MTSNSITKTTTVNLGEIASSLLKQHPCTSKTGSSFDAKPTGHHLPSGFELDDAATRAYDALENNSPVVFLTGKAGTGKSTFIEYVRQYLSRNSIVLAPTGVAALNVRGQTIHSFFKFPPRLFDDAEIQERRDTLIDRLQLIIIDEISMVRADLLDHIDAALRKWRRSKEPFGGIQVLLIGDCLQLPPVVAGRSEREFFNFHYRTPWFFGAKVLKQTPVAPAELTTSHRQEDPEFIEILDRIRTNSDHRTAVAEINRRCCRNQNMGEHHPDLTLTATNRHAASINSIHLAEISEPSRTFTGKKMGRFGLDDQRLPAPEKLELKVGAQVMVTKNIAGAVNGSIGKVMRLSENLITISLKSQDEEIAIQRETWEQFSYKWDSSSGAIRAEPTGSYEQFPLMLGWAVTIHKSQELTLNSTFIDLGRGAFAPGQTYVALSRCKSIEGIRLARPISMKDVLADSLVLDFHARLFGNI